MGAWWWEQFLAIPLSQIQWKQYPSNKKVYLAHNKLKRLNTKNLKNMYVITVGTDNPQCAEPSNPIIKCESFNRILIQNCTSVYQMKLCTIRSDLIIIRIPFEPIKWYKSSGPIDYLLCNQCEVHLSDKDTDKANGAQFIWPAFYWSILRCKDIHNNGYSEFIWNFPLWNGVNSGLMRLYSNFRIITTVFWLKRHNQYLWI